ncbi:MAG: L-threonylcarbamoyladenylate synthase [Desulfosalsimonas sp.]
MTDKPGIEKIDPLAPDPGLIGRAADIIAGGGLVIYPTRNLYGLAVDAKNPGAVKKVFEIKKRSPNNPVSILISSRRDLYMYAKDVSDTAERVMDRFWPGGITMVFKATPGLPDVLTAGTRTIGVRLPAHPAAAALTKAAGTAITATSANLSGDPGPSRIRDINQSLAEAVDLVLDAGTLEPGTGSTVLDAASRPHRILRHGSVTYDLLRDLLEEGSQ